MFGFTFIICFLSYFVIHMVAFAVFFPVFFLLYDKYWYEYCPSGSQLLLRLEQFTGKAKEGRQLD